MRRERHCRQIVAPGHRAKRVQRIRIQFDRRAGLPQREQAPIEHGHRGIGGVDVVVVAARLHVWHRGAGSAIQKATGLLLPGELVRGHHARLVPHLRPAQPPAVHHAVAIEPVRVAESRTLGPGRAVAIQAAGQPIGQRALQCCRGRGKGRAGDAAPAQQPRGALQLRMKRRRFCGLGRQAAQGPATECGAAGGGQQGLQKATAVHGGFPCACRRQRICTLMRLPATGSSKTISSKSGLRMPVGLLLKP